MGKDRRNILGQHTVGAQQDCPPGPLDHSANIINQGSREMTRSGDPERAPVFQLWELEGGWSGADQEKEQINEVLKNMVPYNVVSYNHLSFVIRERAETF